MKSLEGLGLSVVFILKDNVSNKHSIMGSNSSSTVLMKMSLISWLLPHHSQEVSESKQWLCAEKIHVANAQFLLWNIDSHQLVVFHIWPASKSEKD